MNDHVLKLIHGVGERPEPARDWLLVSETFYTLQGEGPSTGSPAFFVRLGTCNQRCRWCDTAYTWAFTERQAAAHESGRKYDPAKELKRESIARIAHLIGISGAPLVVITGGEPMIQRETVSSLVSLCNESIYAPEFEIETAGTIAPGELGLYHNVAFNVSPKLQGSGNPKDVRYKPEVLHEFALHPRTTFKFVIDTRDNSSAGAGSDLAEVEDIVEECHITNNTIWLMPCSRTQDELEHGLRVLAEICKTRYWHLSGRQQITIWGDERGH